MYVPTSLGSNGPSDFLDGDDDDASLTVESLSTVRFDNACFRSEFTSYSSSSEVDDHFLGEGVMWVAQPVVQYSQRKPICLSPFQGGEAFRRKLVCIATRTQHSIKVTVQASTRFFVTVVLSKHVCSLFDVGCLVL